MPKNNKIIAIKTLILVAIDKMTRLDLITIIVKTKEPNCRIYDNNVNYACFFCNNNVNNVKINNY